MFKGSSINKHPSERRLQLSCKINTCLLKMDINEHKGCHFSLVMQLVHSNPLSANHNCSRLYLEIILLLFKVISLDISCESTSKRTINMKCQNLLSLKKKKKKKKKKKNRISSASNLLAALRVSATHGSSDSKVKYFVYTIYPRSLSANHNYSRRYSKIHTVDSRYLDIAYLE